MPWTCHLPQTPEDLCPACQEGTWGAAGIRANGVKGPAGRPHRSCGRASFLDAPPSGSRELCARWVPHREGRLANKGRLQVAVAAPPRLETAAFLYLLVTQLWAGFRVLLAALTKGLGQEEPGRPPPGRHLSLATDRRASGDPRGLSVLAERTS